MIILGLPGSGKSSLAKTSENYVDLKIEEFEYTYTDWVKKYVGVATLLSDAGYDVLMTLRKEVLDEIEKQMYGALIVIPRDISPTIYGFVYTITKDSEVLHAVVSGKYITEALVASFREKDLFKNNTSKYTFIWGMAKGKRTKATAYTENLITVYKEKLTGLFFLEIDDKIIEDNDSETLSRLLFKLKRWYNQNSKVLLPNEVSLAKLSDLYDGVSFTTGGSISDIIIKMGAFIIMAAGK